MGLTGGIATGKTTVSNILRQSGIPVIDADQVARQVQLPNSPGLLQIAATFGSQVLLPTGELDRSALAKIVFNNEQARQKLNDIVQPLIREEIWQRVTVLKKQQIPWIVLDIPLLFEQHYDDDCDLIVVVYTDSQIQLKRLMLRDNCSEKAAQARIAAQMPLVDKIAKADIKINNDGSQQMLQKQVSTLISRLKTK